MGEMDMNWEELKDESTADLIDYIKCKEQNGYKELAEAAFIAFTFRYRKEMIDRCRRVGQKNGYDREITDMIAERTFERFWRYPFSFEKGNCGKLSIDNCVILYLFKIARNCFFDYRKDITEGSISPYDGSESIIIEFPDIDKMEIPEERLQDIKKMHDLLDKALSRLSPKHKTIYLTYKAFEKEGYKLPRPLLKTLREELDLRQNSIRVYKNEAFQTVEQYFKLYGTK